MKRKPRAEPPPFGGNPEARAPTSRSQTGLPHRDVERPCFFLPERAVRPTKKPRRACGTLRGEAAACGPAADSTMPAPSIRSASQPLVPTAQPL